MGQERMLSSTFDKCVGNRMGNDHGNYRPKGMHFEP